MSKQLQEYSATLISINAVPNQQDSDWSWRLRYVGNKGKISIMQDEYKRPNKVFITMAITDEAKYYGGGNFRRHFYAINFDCLIKPCSSINLFKINGDRYI